MRVLLSNSLVSKSMTKLLIIVDHPKIFDRKERNVSECVTEALMGRK